MSRILNLKKALESLDDVPVEETPSDIVVPESVVEADLDQAATGVDEHLDLKKETAHVVEGLDTLEETATSALDTEGDTTVVNELVEDSLENLMLSLNVRRNSAGLEGYATSTAHLQKTIKDIQVVREIALEGLGLSLKKTWDVITDTFKTVEGEVRKYQGRVTANRNDIKAKLREAEGGDVVVPLGQVSSFFFTGEGAVQDIIPALEADLERFEYVMVDFSKVMVSYLNDLNKTFLINHMPTKDAFLKSVQAVEKMKTLGEQFSPKYLGGAGSLGGTTFTIDKSTPQKPVTIDGKTYTRLSEMSAGDQVLVTKVASKDKSTKTITIAAKDIERVISLGERYLVAIRQHLQLQAAMHNATEAFTKSRGFEIDETTGLEGDETTRTEKVTDVGDDEKLLEKLEAQVVDVFDLGWGTIYSLTMKETSRGLKAAKYCNYIAELATKQVK